MYSNVQGKTQKDTDFFGMHGRLVCCEGDSGALRRQLLIGTKFIPWRDMTLVKIPVVGYVSCE